LDSPQPAAAAPDRSFSVGCNWKVSTPSATGCAKSGGPAPKAPARRGCPSPPHSRGILSGGTYPAVWPCPAVRPGTAAWLSPVAAVVFAGRPASHQLVEATAAPVKRLQRGVQPLGCRSSGWSAKNDVPRCRNLNGSREASALKMAASLLSALLGGLASPVLSDMRLGSSVLLPPSNFSLEDGLAWSTTRVGKRPSGSTLTTSLEFSSLTRQRRLSLSSRELSAGVTTVPTRPFKCFRPNVPQRTTRVPTVGDRSCAWPPRTSPLGH